MIQEGFELVADAVLVAQEEVKKGARYATVVRFEMNSMFTYRVYVGKTGDPCKDRRVGERFRPFGWVFQYAPDGFMKLSETYLSDVECKSEFFKIKPDGSLEKAEFPKKTS